LIAADSEMRRGTKIDIFNADVSAVEVGKKQSAAKPEF
jgi:hypothetical protein